MTPPQLTADDWRYAALSLAPHSHGPGKPICAVTCYSIDEDNILERLLAEYWDAKDRSAAHTRWERGSSRHPCGNQKSCNSSLEMKQLCHTASAEPGTEIDCRKL